eukprot:sb/3467515/
MANRAGQPRSARKPFFTPNSRGESHLRPPHPLFASFAPKDSAVGAAAGQYSFVLSSPKEEVPGIRLTTPSPPAPDHSSRTERAANINHSNSAATNHANSAESYNSAISTSNNSVGALANTSNHSIRTPVNTKAAKHSPDTFVIHPDSNNSAAVNSCPVTTQPSTVKSIKSTSVEEKIDRAQPLRRMSSHDSGYAGGGAGGAGSGGGSGWGRSKHSIDKSESSLDVSELEAEYYEQVSPAQFRTEGVNSQLLYVNKLSEGFLKRENFAAFLKREFKYVNILSGTKLRDKELLTYQ